MMESILAEISWLRVLGLILQLGCFLMAFVSKRALDRVEKKAFDDFFVHLSFCALGALLWEIIQSLVMDPVSPVTGMPRIYDLGGLVGGWLYSWMLFSVLTFIVPTSSGTKDQRGKMGKK